MSNTKDVLFSFRMSDVNITFGKNDEKKAYIKEYATQLYDKWFKKFMEPFERKKEGMNAYQRGMLQSAMGSHHEMIKSELVRYLPQLSFSHFLAYNKLVRPRLYSYYCFALYIENKIKSIGH